MNTAYSIGTALAGMLAWAMWATEFYVLMVVSILLWLVLTGFYLEIRSLKNIDRY
jgi:hypothetical protein